MTRSIFFRVVFVVSIAAYPFIIFFGLNYLPPSAIGVALLVLLATRYGVLLPDEKPVLIPVLLVFLLYAAAATVSGNQTMLLYYPAVVNFTLTGVFLNSLRQEEPLLLRLVRARGIKLSAYAPTYLYRLTAIWALFFVINGLISIWTSTQSLEIWTLYNGFLSYCLIAFLFGVEYVFRRYYKRRKGVSDS